MFYEKLCSILKNCVLCSKNLKKKKMVKRKKKTTFLEKVSFTDLIDARTKNFSLVSLQGIACSIPRDVSKSKKFCSVKTKDIQFCPNKTQTSYTWGKILGDHFSIIGAKC